MDNQKFTVPELLKRIEQLISYNQAQADKIKRLEAELKTKGEIQQEIHEYD